MLTGSHMLTRELRAMDGGAIEINVKVCSGQDPEGQMLVLVKRLVKQQPTAQRLLWRGPLTGRSAKALHRAMTHLERLDILQFYVSGDGHGYMERTCSVLGDISSREEMCTG